MKEYKKNIFKINFIVLIAFLIMSTGIYTVNKHISNLPAGNIQMSEAINTQHNN